jgi:hypothetical protein
VTVFPLLVIVHALAATVWTGGHLVLDLGVLPRALSERSAAQIRLTTRELPPPALQRGEPHAQQRRHRSGPCTSRDGLIEDLQGLAAILRWGQSTSSSPQ